MAGTEDVTEDPEADLHTRDEYFCHSERSEESTTLEDPSFHSGHRSRSPCGTPFGR